MALQKEIVDQKHVIEISKTTGLVEEYDKNVLDGEISYKNKIHRLDSRECSGIINKEFGNFIAYFYNEVDKIDIADQYKMRFIYLSTFLDYDTNNIVTGSSKAKTNVFKDELENILRLSRRETRYTVKELLLHNLIVETNGIISINPKYAKKGSVRRSKQIHTRIFIKAIRDLYEATKATNHKQLYYFFKIIPYIHTQKNVITKDIYTDSNEIVPIDFKELCEIIGIDCKNPTRTYNSIGNFKVNGEFVLSKHMIGDIEMFYINPRIYYGGTNPKELTKLIEMFDIANHNTKLHN